MFGLLFGGRRRSPALFYLRIGMLAVLLLATFVLRFSTTDLVALRIARIVIVVLILEEHAWQAAAWAARGGNADPPGFASMRPKVRRRRRWQIAARRTHHAERRRPVSSRHAVLPPHTVPDNGAMKMRSISPPSDLDDLRHRRTRGRVPQRAPHLGRTLCAAGSSRGADRTVLAQQNT